MPITREQFETEGREVMEFLRTHNDQAWAIWEIAQALKIPTGDVAIALDRSEIMWRPLPVTHAGSLIRSKFRKGYEYFLYVRPGVCQAEGSAANGPQFWVSLELNATVKHFLVDAIGTGAKFRTACGIRVNAYFPSVEGRESCPKCLEYARSTGVKDKDSS